ncbi:MAG: acetyl-CoA carboxylase carboxyl transferase subunit beta, partial [Xenococcus sp. (in: cyanobacteria)]
MSLIDWFANRRKTEPAIQKQQEREIADGLWSKCQVCGAVAYTKDLKANQLVCLECGYHSRVDSDERIKQLIDTQTWQPLGEEIRPTDPLEFNDRKAYRDRIKDYQAKTGLTDAVKTGIGLIDGLPLALGVMDFRFMGGSMGSVVGERLCRLI